MSIDPTLDFYNRHAAEYAARTFGADVSDARERFSAKLSRHAHVLDVGCGSGRDSKYFIESGFSVTAIEPADNLARIAAHNTGLEVLHRRCQEIDYAGVFNGIWACASLLHVPFEDLSDVFQRMHRALLPGGLMYASFKELSPVDETLPADSKPSAKRGVGGVDDPRHFTFVTFDEIRKVASDFMIIEYWKSTDTLGRTEVFWLNFLLQAK